MWSIFSGGILVKPDSLKLLNSKESFSSSHPTLISLLFQCLNCPLICVTSRPCWEKIKRQSSVGQQQWPTMWHRQNSPLAASSLYSFPWCPLSLRVLWQGLEVRALDLHLLEKIPRPEILFFWCSLCGLLPFSVLIPGNNTNNPCHPWHVHITDKALFKHYGNIIWIKCDLY